MYPRILFSVCKNICHFSLVSLVSCENMASNSEWIMENSRNFQIVYVGHTNLCKHCTTDHARGFMKLGISQSPHSPFAELSLPLEVVMISSAWRVQPLLGSRSSCKQSRCGRHGLSNILKLQATFLYSIYHHRAGKTNLFHSPSQALCQFNRPLKKDASFSAWDHVQN